MGEFKFKRNWNGALTTSVVFLVLLLVQMGHRISLMISGADPTGLDSTYGMIFVGLFVGVLVSLIGLKLNPKFFALLGTLICLGLIAHILAAKSLYSVESLIATVALIFMLVGSLRLGKEQAIN